MASALSLRADTEFAREVKGEEPREKGKAAPGLRTREAPQRRLLSETGAEPRAPGRAEAAPSSTNQEADHQSSDTRSAEGRSKEGLRGCSSGGAGLPEPGAAAESRPLGSWMTSSLEGPERTAAGGSAAHSSGRISQGVLGKREKRGEDASYDEGEEGTWEAKMEGSSEARGQEVQVDEAGQAEEGGSRIANGRHAARSEPVDLGMGGGIEGIFRTGGITRRRTRPNRFSARPSKALHLEAASAEADGQKEAGLHADHSAQGMSTAAGAGQVSVGSGAGGAEAEAEAVPGNECGTRKEPSRQAPSQGCTSKTLWEEPAVKESSVEEEEAEEAQAKEEEAEEEESPDKEDKGAGEQLESKHQRVAGKERKVGTGAMEWDTSSVRNSQAEELSLTEASGDPGAQAHGQEHSPPENRAGEDPGSGIVAADASACEQGSGHGGGSGERGRGGRGRGRGRPRKGFKRSGQASGTMVVPGSGSKDASSAVSGSEDNGPSLAGAATLTSSPAAEGQPAAELAAPADGEETGPAAQASFHSQRSSRPPSPFLAAAGDAQSNGTTVRTQRKGARSSPPMPFAAASNGAATPHVPTMVTRQRDSGGEKGLPGKAAGGHSGGSKRVIRSRRVQERVARIEGDGDNAFQPARPLCITVALSKEEIHNDLVAIIGHKRTPRAKRSNIPAMGLALCSHLSQPQWNSY